MASGDSSSTTFSDRQRRWKIVLPIVALLVTVCLLIVGHYRYRNVPPELNATDGEVEWTPGQQGPLPAATQVAYAINFPALLMVSPLMLAHTNRALSMALFLVLAGLVWHVIGRMLDARLSWSSRRKPMVIAASAVGLVIAVAGVRLAISILGLHYYVPPVGGLLWAIALAFLCLASMRKAILVRA